MDERIETAMPVSINELKALSEAAKRGDQAALEQLRAALDRSPEIWQRIGDIAGRIRHQIIRMIAEGDHLRIEALQRQLADIQNKLGWKVGSTIERLAIDRLLACWLQQQLAAKMLLEAEACSNNARYWLRYQAQCDRTAHGPEGFGHLAAADSAPQDGEAGEAQTRSPKLAFRAPHLGFTCYLLSRTIRLFGFRTADFGAYRHLEFIRNKLEGKFSILK